MTTNKSIDSRQLIRKVMGRRYVRQADILIETQEVVILEIDMYLKRSEVVALVNPGVDAATGALAPPGILFGCSEDSYFQGRQVKKALGYIEFPAFVGWRLYNANRIGRYTIAVTFIRMKATNPAVRGRESASVPCTGVVGPEIKGA